MFMLLLSFGSGQLLFTVGPSTSTPTNSHERREFDLCIIVILGARALSNQAGGESAAVRDGNSFSLIALSLLSIFNYLSLSRFIVLIYLLCSLLATSFVLSAVAEATFIASSWPSADPEYRPRNENSEKPN